MEQEVFRSLIYERLRAQEGNQEELQLNDLDMFVFGTARQRGILPRELHTMRPEISDRTRAVVWDLILQGALVPGIDNRGPTLLTLHAESQGTARPHRHSSAGSS